MSITMSYEEYNRMQEFAKQFVAKKGGITMLQVEMNGYKRIRKNEARRLYNEGIAVYILPCKVYPDDNHPWIKPYKMENRPFEQTVNEFEYYNCNAETGYYTAYYIREE